MSSWFSRESLSSLRGQFSEQLTSLTREVMEEEEPSDSLAPDPAGELVKARARIQELESTAAKLREETVRSKRVASEQEERCRVAEGQLERMYADHSRTLSEKQQQMQHLQAALEAAQQPQHNFSYSTSPHDQFSPSDWSANFDWGDEERSRQSVQQQQTTSPALLPVSTSNEDRFASALEEERESHKQQIESLEQQYKDRLAALQSELDVYQSSALLASHSVATAAQTETQADQLGACDDFQPGVNTIEQYASQVLSAKLPNLATTLNSLLEQWRQSESERVDSSVSASATRVDRSRVSGSGTAGSDSGSSSGDSGWQLVGTGTGTGAGSTPARSTSAGPASPPCDISPQSKPGSPSDPELLDSHPVQESGSEIATQPSQVFEISSEVWQSECRSLGLDPSPLASLASALDTQNLLTLAHTLATQTLLAQAAPEDDQADSKYALVVGENRALHARLAEVASALELADQQLQRIEASESQRKERESGPVAEEELSETRELLAESLNSHQQLSTVMQDQSQYVEQLETDMKQLQAENTVLKDLTTQLEEHLQQSENIVEQLRESTSIATQNATPDIKSTDANESVVSAELQLSLITELQKEVSSLRKGLQKGGEAFSSEVSSKNSSRLASPEKRIVGSINQLQKALLDKEEVNVKLSVELDRMKFLLANSDLEGIPRIEAQVELKSLKEELISLQQSLERQEEVTEERDILIKQLEQQLQTEISTHEENVNDLCGNIAKLSRELETRQGSLDTDSQSEELHSLRDSIETLNQEQKALLGEAENANKALTRQLEECKKHKDEHERLEILFKNIQDNLDGKDKQLLKIQGDLEESQNKIQDLTQGLESEMSDKESATLKITELVKKNSELKKEIEIEKESKRQFQSKCETLIQKLRTASEENNTYCEQFAQMSNKLASFAGEKFELGSKLEELTRERKKLRETIEELKIERDHLQNRIAELKSDLAQSQELCIELTKEIELLVNSNGNPRETAIVNDRVGQLEASMEEEKKRVDELQAKLDDSQNKCLELDQRLLEKSEKLASITSEFESLCATLNEALSTSESDQVTIAINFYKVEIERLSKELSGKGTALEHTNSKCNDSEISVYELNKVRDENDKQKSDASSIVKDMESKQQAVASLTAQVASLEMQLNEKSDALVSANEKYDSQKLKIVELDEISEKQENELATQKHQLDELKGLVLSYEKQLDEALADYTDMKQRYLGVCKKLTDNDKEVQDNIVVLRLEKDTLTRKVTTLEDQLSYLTVENAKYVDQLQASMSEINAKEDSIENKSSEISQMNLVISELNSKLADSLQNSEQLSALQLKFREIERDNELEKKKNSTLTEILSENETGWNEKFKEQQDALDEYLKQNYSMRTYIDQLSTAYNQKLQQVTDLETEIENITRSNQEQQVIIENVNQLQSPLDVFGTVPENSELNLAQQQSPPDLLKSGANIAVERGEEIRSLRELMTALEKDCDLLREELQIKNSSIEKCEEEIQKLKSADDKQGGELRRLREHLMQMEEGYTQEALRAEEREKQLRTKLYEAEERAESLGKTVSSADAEVWGKVGELERAVASARGECDTLETKLEHTTDQMHLYRDASENLQLVLERLQREKSSELEQLGASHAKEVAKLTDERKAVERQVKKHQDKLNEQGKLLEQAAHLNSELEIREEEILTLKQEVETQANSVGFWKRKVDSISGGERVEKQLVRNLLVAYLTVPANKRQDALAMIARFLEFSQDERAKCGVDQQKGGWFSGWLANPASGGAHPSTATSANQEQESFTRKFIAFLETESSQPKVLSLPPHHFQGPASVPGAASTRPTGSSREPGVPSHSHAPNISPGFNPFSSSMLPQLQAHPQSGDTTTEQPTSGSELLDYPPSENSRSLSNDQRKAGPVSSFLKDLLKDD